MESKSKVLQKLFLSTLYLSAFTFGGGYVIVTLMKKKFVDEYHWIEENEMLDLVAIAQSSPGPIAVNGAIVVGYKLAGMIGVAGDSCLCVCSSLFFQGQRDLYCTGLRCHRCGADDSGETEGCEMIYFQLFLSFFQIGLLSFGGGYAAMPLIQGQVVQGHGWLSMSEFTDLITISQMTPGPIAVNSATFVGIKIAGIPGALVATFGCILPSCILVTLLAKLYLKYREMAMLQGILHSLRPAVVAMIGSAGISILVTAFWSSEGDTVIRLAQTNWSLVVIFIISLILLQKGKKNPIFVMVLAGVMKVAVALVEKFAACCGTIF